MGGIYRGNAAFLLAGVLLALSTATRLALLLALPAGAIAGYEAVASLALGLLFDLVVAAFVCAPLYVVIVLAPAGLAAARPWRGFILLWWAAIAYGLTLVAVAEWLFWDEFGGRFNFIAVDYLLYTHEVWSNIRESYPVGTLLVAFALPALPRLSCCGSASGREPRRRSR
jgi:hypothetical protein